MKEGALENIIYNYANNKEGKFFHFGISFAEVKMTFAAAAAKKPTGGSGGLMKSKNTKPEEIRKSNIQAAKALSDAVRTSLGPRGMDKMIQVSNE